MKHSIQAIVVRKRRAYLDQSDPVRMNLALHIKNFGPISNANIALKPLTVLVGPNNSGKSYAAMLIHSVVSACALPNPSAHRTSLPARSLDRFLVIHDKIEELHDKIEMNEKKEMVLPDSLINEIAESWFETILNNNLLEKIKHNFTSKPKDLVRITETNFNISIFNSNQIHVGWKNNKWSVSDFPMLNLKIIFKTKSGASRLISTNNNSDGSITCTLAARLPGHVRSSILSEVLYSLIDDKIRRGIPPQSHYLPAARSGILQGHRAITASIIRDAPYAGIKGTQVPPLSGVVADFISTIITMPPHEGEFYRQAEDLESNILGGQIRRVGDKHRLSEIKYNFLEHEIPLHKTSSTVSEMSPLILYLKHIVSKGSLLIIEEPEAHLHPSNQVILARHIARLIRSDLNILLTTHSQPLLEQLSLLLQASKVDQKTRKDMGLDPDEFLLEDEVSPYLFTQTAPGNHTAVPIECSGDEGISQEEFVKVQDALYNQTICVEQKMLPRTPA